jgi:hypothetical protein
MSALFVVIFTIISIRVAAIEDLDPAFFKTLVLNDEKVWLVDFYSKLCHACAAFAPTWAKLEDKVYMCECFVSLHDYTHYNLHPIMITFLFRFPSYYDHFPLMISFLL